MKQFLTQIFKFGFVGITAFIIDWGLLVFFTELCGLYYLLSNVLAFIISTIYNYLLSTRWVFETDGRHSRTVQMVVFWILTLVGLGINTALMWLLVDVLGIHYMISKVIATFIVMVYNFIWRKLFLEGKKPKDWLKGSEDNSPRR